MLIKLPQEWWIHVAQLDFTDTVAEVPWFGPAVLAALVLAGVVYWFAARPRQPARDWSWRVAAEPRPAEAATAAGRNRWVATHSRLLSAGNVEKVVLVGLLWVVYSQILPGTRSTPGQLFLGTRAPITASTTHVRPTALSAHIRPPPADRRKQPPTRTLTALVPAAPPLTRASSSVGETARTRPAA